MTFDDAIAVLRTYRHGTGLPWEKFHEAIDVVLDRHIASPIKFSSCPFCGSTKEPVVKEADESFEARYGCGECDRWWGPAILKGRGP
jgi:hypothetical protein